MTILANVATLSAMVANEVGCEKVYMNGALVFESGNSLTVGSGQSKYGYSNKIPPFGDVSQKTFSGYSGSIDEMSWYETGPDDTWAILRLSTAPYPAKVQVTVGETALIFQGAFNGSYTLNISPSAYNALPKSGTVKVKFEVVA